MNPPRTGRLTGLPLDRLMAVYLIASGVALAFPGRPEAWPMLVALHGLAAAAFWPLPPLRRLMQLPGSDTRRRLRTAADWAPLLLIPVLYKELAVLNRAVHGGTYFDAVVIDWEQTLFRSQPSQDWAEAVPALWLSEPLHFAYLSYYFIIIGPPLMLFVMRRTAAFRLATFTLMLSFFAHYLFFIYFPVQGPRYLFAAPAGELADGIFYQFAHRVLEAGSAQGAAFPSSHVGVSVTQTLIMLRFIPKLAPLLGVLTAGLAVGAVYGGFHYAIDAVAGAMLGALVYFAGVRIYTATAGPTAMSDRTAS